MTPSRCPRSALRWRHSHQLLGFTVTELLVAMGISAVVLAGVATLLSLAATSLSGTTSQTSINYRASSTSEFISSRIRFATKVDNGGDFDGNTVRAAFDDNLSVDSDGDSIAYNDKDHNEIFQFQNGDGKDGTLADNRLIYKPRENQPGTVVLIASGVRPLPGKQVFVVTNGATVLMNFAVVDNYARDGYQTCDIQGAVVPRNRAASTNVVASLP